VVQGLAVLEPDGTDEYLWLLFGEWIKSLTSEQRHKIGIITLEEYKELKRKRRKLRRIRMRIAELEDEIAERRLAIYESDLSAWL
jgi:hypothetical protein